MGSRGKYSGYKILINAIRSTPGDMRSILGL
nr:MAG TPA: hypothetical protein [Caudoviricetes sp.]